MLPSPNSKLLNNSSSGNNLFPSMFILSIVALSPSSTIIFTSTLFLGLVSSSTSTFAPYLPCDAYDLTNSAFILSNVDLLYTLPSDISTPSKLSNNCSVLRALLPDISIAEIEGLS